MSRFDVVFGSVENVDKSPKDKRFETVQLVDEISAVYKNENCENQEEEENITMAPENTIKPFSQKFRFESETKAEKEKMHNKVLKTSVILTLCFLLLNFVLVFILMNRTSEISSSLSSSTRDFSALANQTHETREIVDELKFGLTGVEKWVNSTEEKFESHHFQIEELLNQTKIGELLKALENELRHQELTKSHEELKEQFESLSQKFEKLESNLSLSNNVSLLRPPPENEDQEPNPQSLKSCSDAMEFLPSPRSKKQTIYPHGNSTSLEVLCDFETDGGGWTIVQKRSSGPKEDFNQNWREYSSGFGSLDKNFWIGLENIQALTQNGDQELRIEMEDFEGNKRWAKYSSFSVSDASDFYRLSISGYSGDAGNDMIHSSSPNEVHNGMRFSTWDKDTDKASSYHCAAAYSSGWWFNSCHKANLNGLYFEKGETVPFARGIDWFSWKGHNYSLAKTEMKIRKRK